MKKIMLVSVLTFLMALPVVAQTWSLVQNMPIGRHRHCSEAATDNNGTKRVFVFSGGSDSQSYSSVYGYNPSNDTWAQFANIPTPRVSAASAVLSNKIYVIGGINGGFSNGLNTVEVYDAPNDSWSTAANLPVTLSEAAAVASGGKIYVFGGYQPNIGNTLNSTYEYDPGTNTWTQKANMPGSARAIGAARACNGKIYVIGNNVNYQYNPGTNTWVTKTAAPTSQQGRAVVIGRDQRIYLINDRSYNTSSDPVVYYYRFTNDTWYQAPNNNLGYTVPAAAHLNGRLYLTGGTVRFSPQTTRTEKSSSLASCFCWRNGWLMCAIKAVAVDLNDKIYMHSIESGGGPVFETGDTNHVFLDWDRLNANEGTIITVKASGNVNGEAGSNAGNLTMSGSAEGVDLTGDFSSFGTQSWRAEAYDSGKLVAVFEGEGETAGASADMWPIGAAVSHSSAGEASLISRFEGAALIRINGEEVMAD